MGMNKSLIDLSYEALINNYKQLHTNTHVVVLTNDVCVLLHARSM